MHKIFSSFIFTFLVSFSYAQNSLMVYVGAASKPPTQEIIQKFQDKYNVRVDANYGGSGYVLSQMILARQGDIYFPGSSDYMLKAIQKDVVYKNSEKRIVYLVQAINVRKGNPKNIKSLSDLTKPGIRVAIANPEGVCVGAYAVETIENSFTQEQKSAFLENLVNYTGSCAKTASAISLKQVDAVIGWRVFENWDPKRIESIALKASEISRIAYIPMAISKFSKKKKLAQQFMNFFVSKEAKAIFHKYKYLMSAKEANLYIGVDKPVGGQYIVPKEWIQ
ncbi:MAG: molybdate ABC transporter substrate-binding protein [Candidatus Cloacimonetes bacterium]|nr:molybdate ABC transporter substrate-binding protein [Candidatus Cloacimonadota bacterium]